MSTFNAGQTLKAVTVEDVVDGWDTYVPTWTGSGSDPVIVNGVITGRYKQVGKLVTFAMQLTLGTLDTVGTGFYSIGIPVASGASAIDTLLNAQFFDVSAAGAAQYSQGFGQLSAGASNVIRIRLMGENNANATIANWSATNPVAPAVGDIFNMSGSYESA